MKKEILFLVYQPEWWGCMDKMYREYQEKEDWQCTVLVLPRFARDIYTGEIQQENRKHDIGKMPDDVKQTPYNRYDLSEHWPEKIVIHNPYDGSNPMETVEPQWFSSNLKTYTEELIYLPHMLYRDMLPDKEQHYPVYKYADTIVIPTEAMRYAFDACYAKKLVVVDSGIREYLGSLQKKHTDKTRLLYSVNYADLHYYTDRQIAKMKYIFSFFHGHPEIELIFRPDDDILQYQNELDATVRTEYFKLIQDYVQKDGGIVDLSEDLYQAVVDADAFLGSRSNLIGNLFTAQGKKCLRLNNRCPETGIDEKSYQPDLFDEILVEGDRMTFATCGIANFLCALNLKAGKLETICELPTEEMNGVYSLWREKDTYWAFLTRDKAIISYESTTGKIEKYYVPTTASEKSKLLYSMIPYENYFYLLPGNAKAIWRFDRTNREFRKYGDWVDKLETMAKPEDRVEFLLYRKWIREADCLSIPSPMTNVILHFHMNTGEYRLEKVGSEEDKFVGVYRSGEWELLLPFKGRKIYLRDRKKQEVRQIYEVPGTEEMIAPYLEAVEWQEGKVLLFPWNAEKVLEVELSTGSVRETCEHLAVTYAEGISRNQRYAYTLVKKIDDKLIVFSHHDGMLRILNDRLQVTASYPIRLKREQLIPAAIRKIERYVRKNGQYGEAMEWFPMSLMVEYLKAK